MGDLTDYINLIEALNNILRTSDTDYGNEILHCFRIQQHEMKEAIQILVNSLIIPQHSEVESIAAQALGELATLEECGEFTINAVLKMLEKADPGNIHHIIGIFEDAAKKGAEIPLDKIAKALKRYVENQKNKIWNPRWGPEKTPKQVAKGRYRILVAKIRENIRFWDHGEMCGVLSKGKPKPPKTNNRTQHRKLATRNC